VSTTPPKPSASPSGARSSKSATQHFDVTAPDARGEQLRSHAPGWHNELEAFLQSLNDLVAKVNAPQESARARRFEALRQPLVMAAVVTALATGGSSLAIYYFQAQQAANAQAQELYKTKLEFASIFGDTFPRSLNLLLRNTRAGLWLDRNKAAAVEPPGDAPAQQRAAHQDYLAQWTRFEETRREMLEAKKTSTLCAQALMLFDQSADRPLDQLRANIKAIQDLRDDEETPYQVQEQRLNVLYNEANEAFTRVLNMFGDGLRDGKAPAAKGVSGEVKQQK
jgi:hypothetical protein